MRNVYFGKKKNNDEVIQVCNDGMQNFTANAQGIEHQDSRIFFYKDVEDESVLNLIRLLKEKAAACIQVQNQFELESPPPIKLHIQSYGGLLFSGFSGMEHIRTSKVPVVTIVDGMAASAATFLSVVGHKRYMYEESSMLIHQLSSGFWGKFEEFLDEKKNLEMLMERIRRIYKTYTRMDDKLISNILKKDIYLTSEQCLAFGLVDEICSR